MEKIQCPSGRELAKVFKLTLPLFLLPFWGSFVGHPIHCYILEKMYFLGGADYMRFGVSPEGFYKSVIMEFNHDSETWIETDQCTWLEAHMMCLLYHMMIILIGAIKTPIDTSKIVALK